MAIPTKMVRAKGVPRSPIPKGAPHPDMWIPPSQMDPPQYPAVKPGEPIPYGGSGEDTIGGGGEDTTGGGGGDTIVAPRRK